MVNHWFNQVNHLLVLIQILIKMDIHNQQSTKLYYFRLNRLGLDCIDTYEIINSYMNFKKESSHLSYIDCGDMQSFFDPIGVDHSQ